MRRLMADRVMVLDATRLKALATIAVDRTPIRFAVSPDGATAVTSNHGGGDLTLIDVATRRVTRTIRVAGANATAQVTILFAADGRRLYVAETGAGRVAEVDLASGRALRWLAAGRQGDGLGVARVVAGDAAPR